jgi:hypothetical protein
MNLLESVAQELQKMERGIAAGDGPAISDALRKLDEAARSGNRDLPPRLLHFLERRSYEKALLFLKEEGLAAGPESGSPGKGAV